MFSTITHSLIVAHNGAVLLFRSYSFFVILGFFGKLKISV